MGMPGGRLAGVELTREQELTLQQLKGASVKRALRQIVTSPGYAQLPDERKIVVLEAAIDEARWRVQQGVRQQVRQRGAQR